MKQFKILSIFIISTFLFLICGQETLAKLPPITQAKIAEIRELLQHKDMADKLGAKLRAEIDSLLSKKENYIFYGYILFIWKITYPEFSNLVASCSLALETSYNDKSRVSFSLHNLPSIMYHPYIRRLGLDSVDCLTKLEPISRERLSEAKKFEEKYLEKRRQMQRSSKSKAGTNINLNAKLYVLKESNIKDTTLTICVLLSEKWSKKIERNLKRNGVQNIKKIRDYLVEGEISPDKIEELFSDPYVLFLGLTDERNEIEVLEYIRRDRSKVEPL